jgi:hypothetical protein
MLPLILYKKAECYGKEQHKELPEIMRPFFSAMSGARRRMMMHFHIDTRIFVL